MDDQAPKRIDAQTLAVIREFDSLPDMAFVKRPVVEVLFGGVSDEEVRRRTLDGRIPKPTKLGSRNNIWQVGQLREALANLQARAALLPTGHAESRRRVRAPEPAQ